MKRHHLISRVGCAWAAFVVGAAYALVSLGWALGSTWALDTVGGTLEARAGSPALTALVWATVLLKLTAAGLGLAVVLPRVPPRRPVVLAAWAAALVLNAYGGALTLGGLLVQADVLHATQDADHYAMAWHTYFWDPWFLVWGLLLTAALWRSTSQRAGAASPPISEPSIR